MDWKGASGYVEVEIQGGTAVLGREEVQPAPFAAVVLCGGGSRRMGTDKALVTHNGVRLVDRVYGRLRSVADPVFFAPGREGRLGALPGDEVGDALGDRGPLGGVVAALERSPHEILAVVAVDMPWCSASLFTAAASLWQGEDAVVPVDKSGQQVLHALYSRAVLPRFRDALNEDRLSLRTLLGDLKVLYLDESVWAQADPSGRFALNLNRPEDLALLAEFSE